MSPTARLLTTLLLALGFVACVRDGGVHDVSTAAYADVTAAFDRGVAAALSGETRLAAAAFRRVTELAPEEPAGWANLGLVALQRFELDDAAAHLAQARALAPDDSRIRLLSALVARERGQLDTAEVELRAAAGADGPSPRALYLLAQLVEQDGRPEGPAEAQRLLDRLLAREPSNLAALLDRARLAATSGDLEGVGRTLSRIEARLDTLGLLRGGEPEAVRAAAGARDFDAAASRIAAWKRTLQPLPAYQDDQSAVLGSPSRVEGLLTRFVRLPSRPAQAAAPDTTLAFVADTLSIVDRDVSWVRALWLSDEVPFALAASDGRTVWLSIDPGLVEAIPFPGGASPTAPSPAALAVLDYDHDFRRDIVLAGSAGVRLLRHDDGGTVSDVTGEAFAPGVARGAYAGAWAADLDMEGDMDLVLGAADGEPVVLQNRGDGTFVTRPAFAGVTRLRDFLWADLDADGDPDAALLDGDGRLHVFLNRRHYLDQFQPHRVPDTLGAVQAIAGADLDRDATIDLVLVEADGTVSRLSLDGEEWEYEPLLRWPDLSAGAVGTTRLFVADLDNNGDLDVVGSAPNGARAWLRTPSGYRALRPAAGYTTSVADLDRNGRLDLLGVAPNGRAQWMANRGTRDYYSASIHPNAAQTTGDLRINAFGVGGEVEVRAGLLYQKRLLDGAPVHFGLGEARQIDVARITWPNGTVQAEFNLDAANETILTRQRLKGSCPWVFTYDGDGMQFVTDFIWRSALGLRINAQGDAAVIHSEDWIRIRGDQLAPHDGAYEVRITAELWETHFFDHVGLMVVDHPADLEVFVDERFTLPAPDPTVHAMTALRPVVWARDQSGRDVTALVGDLDERFVDTFALGAYQGIAEEHYVEVALGDDVPARGPVWLVASGWVYPTDASINVAVSQGDHPAPRGIRLEVPDGAGGWATVVADYGLPAGKTKTVLIDLEHAFRPGTPRLVRLRTNMEIYWDRIAWAVGRPDAPISTVRLAAETADLRYRGFSQVTQAGRTAPELPVYEELAAATPQWRDLAGFHTRFGDVRPLLEAVDDRYVIMNAGDEIVLRFPAQPPPRAGWARDFVLIGDGWVKDGDYNTGFSTTVLPLPYHGMRDYARPPGRLEDDPAYRMHPGDWEHFHTRYVTPRQFHRALAPARAD